MSTYHGTAYEAAIALNNNGIGLLQQSCCECAGQTLREALEVLRFSFTPKKCSGQDNDMFEKISIISAEKVPIHITAASQRLARHSGKCFSCSGKKKIDSENSNSLNLRILSDDRTLESLTKAALDTDVLNIEGDGEDFLTVHAIHIDDQVDYDEPEIDLAILLNNLGVACHYFDANSIEKQDFHCYSSTSPLSEAYDFYLASYFVLAMKSEQVCRQEYRHIILLSILILQNLVVCALRQDYADDAFEYYREICQLRAVYVNITSSEEKMAETRRQTSPAA